MKGLGCEGSSHTRGTCLFSSWDHRHSSASGANYSFSPISSSMLYPRIQVFVQLAHQPSTIRSLHQELS
jgi:hypothetical protein